MSMHSRHHTRSLPVPAFVGLLGIAVLALVFIFFLWPFLRAGTAMPQGEPLDLLEREDGSFRLSWPQAEGADLYRVELLSAGEGKKAEVIWSQEVEDTACDLPGGTVLSDGSSLRVTSARRYRMLWMQLVRMGSHPLSGAWTGRPATTDLSADVDPDEDTMTLVWSPLEDCSYAIGTSLEEAVWRGDTTRTMLAFGTEELETPRKGQTYTFCLYAEQTREGLRYVSEHPAADITVEGEEFLGTVLKLVLTEGKDNFYTLSWNQTKGEHYELQEQTEDGEWELIRSFTDSDPFIYTIGPLKSFSTHTIRLVAMGGHTLPGSEFAATPDQVTFTTGATTRYASIWVLKDLDIYADTSRGRTVGKARTDRCYCVMGEEDGMFLIYYDGGRGYIDSTYCLINLPDYLGDLCAYNITNSYDAIYKVHDYGIPEITGTVITGYEEVGSDYVPVAVRRTVVLDPQPTPPEEGKAPEDGGEGDTPGEPEVPEEPKPPEIPEGYIPEEGETLVLGQTEANGLVYEVQLTRGEEPTQFLVPLLYPTAQKVAQAAQAAQAAGYRLKIYDAYRPWLATRFLYDTTAALLNEEIPDLIYDDMVGDAWDDFAEAVYQHLHPEEGGEETAAPPEEGDTAQTGDSQTPAGDQGDSGQTPGQEDPNGEGKTEPETPEPEPEPRMSFYTLMTDAKYSLGAFLARSGSMHNLGVAVDLTLEDIETGEELSMQTAMHDLSWYSVLGQNDKEADLLATFMTGCGLAPLSSEWWHFQDDELRARVTDLVSRQQGVTRAGWIADNEGWRYRNGDGIFLSGGTHTVSGKRYTFDENGYADYDAWVSGN